MMLMIIALVSFNEVIYHQGVYYLCFYYYYYYYYYYCYYRLRDKEECVLLRLVVK